RVGHTVAVHPVVSRRGRVRSLPTALTLCGRYLPLGISSVLRQFPGCHDKSATRCASACSSFSASSAMDLVVLGWRRVLRITPSIAPTYWRNDDTWHWHQHGVPHRGAALSAPRALRAG